MDSHMNEHASELHRFLILQLSDELQGAEDYHEYAEIAQKLGHTSLASMLNKHAKDELIHFADIKAEFEKTVPDIKTNPLYPLLENLEHWGKEIEKDINNFR